MVFEGRGKAAWREHPSFNFRHNPIRFFPGIKWSVLAFGVYVVIDQISSGMKKRKAAQRRAEIAAAAAYSIPDEHQSNDHSSETAHHGH